MTATNDQQLAASGRRVVRRARLTALGLLVILIVAWELAVKTGMVPEIIIAAPSDVAASMVRFFTTGWENFRPNLLSTLTATVLGFFVGSLAGFLAGTALGTSKYLNHVFNTAIVAFQGLPKVALAPVFVTWFGFGMMSKVVMSALICFFPVFVNTLTGLRSVDEGEVRLLRSLGASRPETLRKLALPNALGHIFAGLKTGVTLALVGVIVGELVGSVHGLGHLIKVYSFQLQIGNVFAIIVLLGLMGWLLYAIVDWFARRVVFWQVESDYLTTGSG